MNSTNMSSSTSNFMPKDIQVILSTMKDLGINDFDQQIVKCLLESTYKYITFILDEAKVYSNYAGKTTIDVDDVKIALQISKDGIAFKPPERAVLLKASKEINKAPLPSIKATYGLKIPSDNFSQACYRLKTNLSEGGPSKVNLVTKTTEQFWEETNIKKLEENILMEY